MLMIGFIDKRYWLLIGTKEDMMALIAYTLER